MSLITIEASKRTTSGKQDAKRLRRSGRIPGVFMEKGTTTAIDLDPKYLPKAFAHAEKTFELSLEGVKRTVKIADVQIDRLKRLAIHVDLIGV